MNKYSGSTFDDFLEEDGILEEVSARAQKRLLSLQITDIMQRTDINKSWLARRLNTDEIHLNSLLDPNDTSITLEALNHLAIAMGKNLKIELA
jgi:predicted glycosyltransferase